MKIPRGTQIDGLSLSGLVVAAAAAASALTSSASEAAIEQFLRQSVLQIGVLFRLPSSLSPSVPPSLPLLRFVGVMRRGIPSRAALHDYTQAAL